MHGCYEALVSGFVDDGLTDMTGFVSEKLNLHTPQGQFPGLQVKGSEEFWQYLMERKNEKSLMGCSRKSNVVEAHVDYPEESGLTGRTGIHGGHAYGILQIFELNNPKNIKSFHDPEKDQKRPFHRLLVVRNPWGATEWQGPWSDQSEILRHWQTLVEDYIAFVNSPKNE